MIEMLKSLFLMLVPRFQIDTVAMVQTGPDEYEPVCIVQDLEEWERPDIVVRVRVFTWLNHAWPHGDSQQAVSWEEYQKNGFSNA